MAIEAWTLDPTASRSALDEWRHSDAPGSEEDVIYMDKRGEPRFEIPEAGDKLLIRATERHDTHGIDARSWYALNAGHPPICQC